jgi:hypothetical protein
MKRNNPAATPQWLATAEQFLGTHLQVLRELQFSAAERAQKYLLFTNGGAVIATLGFIGSRSTSGVPASIWWALGIFVIGVVSSGFLAAATYHGTTRNLTIWLRDMDRFNNNQIDFADVPSDLNANIHRFRWLEPTLGYLSFGSFIFGSAVAILIVGQPSTPASAAASNALSAVVPPPISSLTVDWWYRVFTDPNAAFAGFVALFTLALVVVGGIQAFHLHRTVKATREGADLSRLAVHRQSFDNAFFQLLNRFSETRADVSVTQNGIWHGRAAIQRIYEQMKDHYPVNPQQNELAAIVAVHQLVYIAYEPELGPYFRTLYHIFKFVDHDEALVEQEKIDYANVARAQLSRFELAFMFYNCLTPYGEKFKPLIERYGLLKHINVADLPNINHRQNPDLYANTAFLSQEEREAL